MSYERSRRFHRRLSSSRMQSTSPNIGRSTDPICTGGEEPVGRRAAILAGMEAIGHHELGLSSRLLEGLNGLPGVRLWGIADPARAGERTPTFALRVAGESPRETTEELGRRGLFAWDGNYFALAVMERLGLEASGGA